MSKQAIASVLGVVVVLVVGYFAFGKTKSDGIQNSAMQNGNSSGVESTNPNAKKMSFDAFLKQGGSYECTVVQNVSGVTSTGVVYVDGANVRGDFNSKVSGMSVDTTFLVKDGYSYTWSSALAGKGFKVKIENPGGAGGTATSGSYSFDASRIGEYDCKSWTVDASKFALPTAVTFMDLKAQ